MYRYRYNQILFFLTRLKIKNCHSFFGEQLGEDHRRKNIIPAIDSMNILRLIRKDPVLNRWCSTQVRDHKFNMDGMRHALESYPVQERDYIQEGMSLGESIKLEAVGEAQQRISQAQGDLATWDS